MAKKQKSKLLAMALCASVMTGIYASPVFAGDVVENSITGNNSGLSFTIDRNMNPDGSDAGGIYFSGSNGVSGQIYGHLKIGGEKIAGALIGQSLNLKSMSISTVDGDETITETITVENIKNWNNAAKANENVAGIRREGDETSGGHRTIVEEQLVVNRESKVISNLNASFTVDSSGNLKASTFGNNIGTFSVNEDGVVTAADVTVDGHTGGFNVTGQNDEVVSYLRAGDLRINDFSSWNSSGLTVGDFKISKNNSNYIVELKKHGGGSVFKADGAAGTVEAAGVKFESNNITLADEATVDGVDVSEVAHNVDGIRRDDVRDGKGTTVIEDSLFVDGVSQRVYTRGDIYSSGDFVTVDENGEKYSLNNIGDKTAGISQHKWDTTYFEGAISATGSVSAGGVGDEAKIGGNTTDGGYLQLKDANDQYQKLTANKLATINTVITDEGEVNSLGDVTSKDGTNTYSLNTVGANTQGIKYHDGVTTIGGNTLAVNEDGFVTINNGAFSVGPDGMATVGQNIQLDGELGTVTANDLRASNNVYSENYNLEGVGADLENLAGDFETTNANVAGIKRDDGTLPYGEGRTEIEGVVAVNGKDGRFYVLGEDGTQAAVITNDGTARFGFEDEKHVRLEDGTLKINDANKTTVASLSEDGLMLTDAESGEQTLTATKIADIEGITRDAETGTTTIEGATRFDTNGMNVGNGAVVANTDGSFSAANGAFDVAADGTLTISNANDSLGDKTEIGAGYITMGDTNINGFGIETPYIEAQSAEIGGVEIDGGLVDGVDVGDLDATVNGRLGGIERVDSDNDGDLDTTIIEDSLSANVSTVNMFGENGLDFTYGVVPNGEAGVNVTGNMHFASGSDVTFNYDGTKYDNKSYSLNDLVDGINDLNGRVDVLEDKTTGITYDEVTGSTTITDQVGTDGVQGNNSITVGNDGITMNGNTVVNGSNTAAGGDGTVPDTGDKDIAHTVNGDQLINGDQHVTGNSQFDGSATFGDTVGNQTVIDGGTITTGDTTINGAGMTVGTTNIAKDSVSADKGTFGEGTFGSGEDQTVINNDGVTVGGEDGTSIKHNEISVGDGGYIGGGDVVSGEGVSLNQTAERVGRLENKVGKLEDRIDKVGAMAAAIANLRTMGYDPAAPTEVAVGLGQYRDETGAALGLFHYPNRDFMLSLSVSTSGDEVMGGIGATWKFGRKSPEKVAEIKKAQAEADVRRAEAQKLAKAEELKAAAKEAKIKAQMERHAKLAAERAAEAETK